MKYDENNETKEITEYVLCSLKRFVDEEENLICEMTISPTTHKLVWLVFEQRKYEGNDKELEQFIQKQAEILGII